MHLPNLILDLALILSAAAVTSVIFRWLKQPVVLGYIIAGIAVGPEFTFIPTVIEQESIKIWADIGVIILLFNLGLEFSFRRLFQEGFRIIGIAMLGVLLTLLAGFCLGKLLDWSNMDSIFLGGILSIASTTIIIRAFDELGVKTQKFTNIVTSILIVEDLVAVILMVILSTISISREFEGTKLIMSVGKLVFFLILWFVSGIFFLPLMLRTVKRILNEEVLLILSLALCFALVILALKAGFSPAFGGFIMGSILAETTKAEKIEHLISPLKNLFGAIFFVSVGMLLDLDMIYRYYLPIVCAILILLFGKPLFVSIGSLITGQPLRTAVQSGLSLSQIGEFSFIIASLGLSLRVTSDFLYPIAVAVSVVTTFTTPYMIKLSEPVYRLVEKILPRRLLYAIDEYSLSAEKVRDVSEWRRLLRSNISNTVVFSVIIITVIFLSVNVLQPYFWQYKWSRIITATVAILILSPFLWALASRKGNKEAYSKLWVNPEYRSPLVILQVFKIILALFYLGFLFDRLFSPWIALTGVICTSIVLMLFSGQLQKFYRKIELRFITNLNQRDDEKKARDLNLTPWDTHLSTFKLNAKSPFIGKNLLESKIREQFGVNIASIERDDIVINVPDRFEKLYPHDIISVIGTDEQLKSFQEYVERNHSNADILRNKNDVKLLHFIIHSRSELVGKSIKDSNIRQLTKGLVVGIERNDERILNPESNFVFEDGDMVWIVGSEKRIQVISEDKSK